MIDRTKIPAINTIAEIKPVKIEKDIIDGIPCSYISGSSQPLIKLDFVFKAGEAYGHDPLVAVFTGIMLLESTKRRNAKEIAEALDYLGCEISPSTGMIYSSFSMITLTKHFGKALEIINEILTEPKFDENDFNKLIENKKKQFLIDLENVNFVARREFKKILFGENTRYGKLYNEDDFTKLNIRQLQEHFDRLYNKSNLRLFMSGDVGNENLKLVHEKLLLKAGKPQTDFSFNPANYSEPRKIFIEKKNALQSAIRMGKLVVPLQHEDYYPLQIAVALLGGYFGSRLMQELRENKGYTYGIGAFTVSLQETGYVVITTEVGSSVTNEAIKSVYQVIDDFCSVPVSEEELNNARSYLMGEYLRNFDGCFNTMEAVKSLDDIGLGLDQYDKYWKVLNEITPEKIYQISSRYLKNGYHQVVVGKLN